MKEKESKNVDVGKFLLSRLQVAAARPQEVDKYRVHVEEADKIVALLLGLASRLARADIAAINLKKNWNEDEEVREEGKLPAQLRLPSEKIPWPERPEGLVCFTK